jgi:dipeptidase D
MDIKKLKPTDVWQYFAAICKIPRVSTHEEAIGKYLFNEFKRLGFDPIIDKHHNIFVRKPASNGCEHVPSVLLQGHSDMVGVKRPNSNHDFLNDPIELIRKGEWIHANDTTLGADNGIAIAVILAIFANEKLKHGPLEALITANEEEGMVGIQSFNYKQIQSTYMLNLDSEDDTEVTIGCPGSIDTEDSLPFKRDSKNPSDSTNLQISIINGLGGHSGQMIIEKRINAIRHLFYLFAAIMDECDMQIVKIETAGLAKNVIPPSSSAHICIQKSDLTKVKNIIEA